MMVARYGALGALQIRRAGQLESCAAAEQAPGPFEPSQPPAGVRARPPYSQAGWQLPDRSGSIRRMHAVELGIRAVVVVLAIFLLRVGAFRGGGLNSDLWRAGIGLVLFALGLGFAIWGRLNIGRNWGTPMSRKDEPELVTSGPYRLVRHPIYSGILLAGLGTAVSLSWLWLIALALVGISFVYSATVEERYLTEQFPDTYPTYKRSTKMLVPLVF